MGQLVPATSRRIRSAVAAAALLGASLLLHTARAGAVTIAGFGDSITWAPGYLAQLPAGWETVNLSKGGETSWDGLLRLQELLPTLTADVVVVMEGTNDVRDLGYTLERSVGSLTAMIDAVLAQGMAAVLLAPPPLLPFDPAAGAGSPNARLETLSQALEAEAALRGVPFVNLLDAFAPLAPLEGYYYDSVHPNVLGSQVIAVAATPAITQAIATPEPSTALLLGAGLALLVLMRARR